MRSMRRRVDILAANGNLREAQKNLAAETKKLIATLEEASPKPQAILAKDPASKSEPHFYFGILIFVEADQYLCCTIP